MKMITHLQQSVSPNALRAYSAEFISTFFFVFAAVGSAMAAHRMEPEASSDPAALVATAVAQAFALSTAVYMASGVSGGHVNPAVTFGMAVGGHVSFSSAVFYWLAQLLGATAACILLRVATAGQTIPTTGIAPEMTGFGAAVLEGTATFALVYAVFAAGEREGQSAMGPVAVGLVVGANVAAMGPFTGGSMNPARSFGPAVVSGDFGNHGVYWLGPLIGAGAAAVVYQNVIFPPLPPRESAHGAVETLVV